MSIEEVRALVAERQRYEGWLTALEQRRGETPEHVYARVQQDYDARRAAIVTALHAHAGPLASAADALEGQVETLTTELATVRDERAEAMLRTAVGEFEPAQWDALRETLESRIGALESDRSTLEAERDELRALLVEAGGIAAADAMGQGSGLALDTVVAAPEAVEDVDSEPVVVEPVTAAAVNAVLAEDFGVEDVEAEVVDTAIVEPAVESDAADAADADLFDELAFLRAGAPPAAVPAMHPAVAAASPDDAPSDPRKTLRCAEPTCRSWNLPTEWYCERCGGELNTF
ncbi:MAG: hypothetical protein WCK74_05490 [Gemmatimonadaceae bacterium]